MRDDTRLYRLGWIMLIIVGLLMAALSICYRVQRKTYSSLEIESKKIKKEITEITNDITSYTNDANLRRAVKDLNKKAEYITPKQQISINDIPMIEQ